MCLFALLGMASGSAMAADGVRINIPFPFVVDRTTLPAGQYDFVRNTGSQCVQVLGGKNPSADILVITRLDSESSSVPKDAEIVFDVVGDTHVLSELWIPDMNGFLLHVEKGNHESKIVNPKSQTSAAAGY